MLAPSMDIPKGWTDQDRRNFVSIAKRRQSEHLLGYGVVAIGAQIFQDILTLEETKIRKAEVEAAAAAEAADSEPCMNPSTSLAILED